MKTTDLVRELFSQPTAPFREQFVLEKIKSLSKKLRLPYCVDSYGNLIVGVSQLQELSKGEKLLLFAHTDHPGFHINKQKGDLLEARWFGGAPFDKMHGASVRIYDPSLSTISHVGKILSLDKKPYQRSGLKLKIRIKSSDKIAKGAFGAFDFPGYKISGNKITARVADDLAGCVIALGAVYDTRHLKQRIVGVFTRAEEVGCVGCWSFLEKTKISKKSVAISLEASKTLPGAELGKGPVLRLGDRTTLFDNEACQFLHSVAMKLQKKSKSFRFQRRIMDGGSCEATALNLFGIRTTGLAVPLFNYHNFGSRKPEPEIINLIDVHNGRLLCAEVGRKLPFFRSSSKKLPQALQSNHQKLSRLLGAKSKASFLEIRS